MESAMRGSWGGEQVLIRITKKASAGNIKYTYAWLSSINDLLG